VSRIHEVHLITAVGLLNAEETLVKLGFKASRKVLVKNLFKTDAMGPLDLIPVPLSFRKVAPIGPRSGQPGAHVNASPSRVIVQTMLTGVNVLYNFLLLQLELIQSCIPIVRINVKRVCVVRVNVQEHGKMVRMHFKMPACHRVGLKLKFIRRLLYHRAVHTGRWCAGCSLTGRGLMSTGCGRFSWSGHPRFARGHLGWHLLKYLLPTDLVSFDARFDCTSDPRIQQSRHQTHGSVDRFDSAPTIEFR
jgi:hypothetical protein